MPDFPKNEQFCNTFEINRVTSHKRRNSRLNHCFYLEIKKVCNLFKIKVLHENSHGLTYFLDQKRR